MSEKKDLKKYTEANRVAWNEVTPIHQKARKINFEKEFAQPGYSRLDELVSEKLKNYGIKGKRVAQLNCNNGRETLSMVSLGADSAVGFDISDEAIKEAKKLAKIAGVKCTFVRIDIYDIGEEYNNQFDLVLITIGALPWMPDLSRYFEIVSRMLKKDGTLVVYEEHPFMDMFAVEGEEGYDPDNPEKIVNSYFREDPWVNYDGIDYVGKSVYKSEVNYCFIHPLSEIINGVIKSRVEILEFNEYIHNLNSEFEELEKNQKIPMSYLLIGRKK